jgi:phosphoribosylanthranilate isomerase
MVKQMMVKICGITNLPDALAAIDGGASALGFNFYPKSPRYLAPDRAAELVAKLPANVWKVGVFVNELAAQVAAVARHVGLDIVQLHGNEGPADFPPALRVWKGFRVTGGTERPWLDSPAEAVLLDGPAGKFYGGAGHTFDWNLAGGAKKIILAGGLDAGNVRQAIAIAKPWGVDACSRIESAPGKKDHSRMAAFLAAALAELS